MTKLLEQYGPRLGLSATHRACLAVGAVETGHHPCGEGELVAVLHAPEHEDPHVEQRDEGVTRQPRLGTGADGTHVGVGAPVGRHQVHGVGPASNHDVGQARGLPACKHAQGQNIRGSTIIWSSLGKE